MKRASMIHSNRDEMLLAELPSAAPKNILRMRYLDVSLCILIVFATLFSSSVMAQSPYLYEDFKQGQVHFKSGDLISEYFNYNGVTDEMVFQSDGKRLALDDLDKVNQVVVGDHIFVPFEGRFFEKSGSSELGPFIRYKYRLIEPGKPSGYGGESHTTASTSFSSLADSKMLYDLKLPDEYRIVKTHEFYLLVDGVLHKVNNKKQLKKVFPDKSKGILDFIKDENIDFSKIEDMNRLAEFIEK